LGLSRLADDDGEEDDDDDEKRTLGILEGIMVSCCSGLFCWSKWDEVMTEKGGGGEVGDDDEPALI